MPHAKALCRTLIEEDLKVRWNSYLAPVTDACDEEVLSLMKQAGSGLLIVKGIAGESPDDGPLDARLEPLNDICQRCDAAGLSYVISQNFGRARGDGRDGGDQVGIPQGNPARPGQSARGIPRPPRYTGGTGRPRGGYDYRKRPDQVDFLPGRLGPGLDRRTAPSRS